MNGEKNVGAWRGRSAVYDNVTRVGVHNRGVVGYFSEPAQVVKAIASALGSMRCREPERDGCRVIERGTQLNRHRRTRLFGTDVGTPGPR